METLVRVPQYDASGRGVTGMNGKLLVESGREEDGGEVRQRP